MLRRALLLLPAFALATNASAQEPVSVPEGYEAPQQRTDSEVPPPPTRPAPRAVGDSQRVVLMPTAFTLRARERSLNTYELVSLETEIGVSDHVQVGVQTIIPVGLLAVGVSMKIGWRWDRVAFALHGQVLGARFFRVGAEGVALGGLGAVLTIGNPDHYLNLGVSGWGGVAAIDDGPQRVGALVPHIGGSIRVARRARLVVEAWLPYRPKGRHFFELAMVLYGVRVFGARMWADLGFLRVLCTDDCGAPLKDSPPGVPYLSLGRPF